MSCLSFFIPICHSLCSFSANNFRFFYPSSSLDSEKDKALAQTVIDLRKEIGIKKEVAVFKDASNYKGFFMARGFSFYKPFVIVPPHFFNQNPFAAKWFLRHELAHIKNLDTIIISMVGLITGLAAAIFTTYFAINWFFAWPLIFFITHISGILISRSCEKKADDVANRGASTEELQQALLVWEGFKRINLYIRAKWCPLTISPEGEDRLIFSHPSIASRMRKIQKTLREKKVEPKSYDETSILRMARLILTGMDPVITTYFSEEMLLLGEDLENFGSYKFSF